MVTVAAPLGERSASFGGLWRYGRPTGIAALILILCFLSLYPMVMLLYGSLHSTPPGMVGTFNLDGYIAIATLMGAGGHIVASTSLYGGTRNMLGLTLPRFGITTTFVNPRDHDGFAKAIRPDPVDLSVPSVAAGTEMVKVLPQPGSLSTETVPWWAWVTNRTMLKPRPQPPSSLCAPVSHATVEPPAGAPAALRARIPNAV